MDMAEGDAFRIQLEGRLEVIERTRALQATLTRRLRGPGWQRRLRRRPGVLEALRAQEPVLAEALARVERRARQELWPEAHPARGLVRAFQAQRAGLEALLRARLERLTLRTGATLPELLGRLEELVLAPPAPLPDEAEEVLLHGRQDLLRMAYQRIPIYLPLLIVVGGWGSTRLSPEAVAVLYLLFCLGILLGVPVAMDFVKPGEFWLTPERLVWRAMFGQPVEVRLASIPPGGISSPRRNRLHVEGDRKLTLEELPQARELAALLERHLPEAAAPLRAGGVTVLGAGGTSRGTRPSG
jgi:hypothetical protein